MMQLIDFPGIIVDEDIIANKLAVKDPALRSAITTNHRGTQAGQPELKKG
jgi:hypothetical protein